MNRHRRLACAGRGPALRVLAAVLSCLSLLPDAGAGTPIVLELRPGDHVSIIGNTLAERMQHDGWLEAYLHSRFPEHDLVVRNLGFSGDELMLRLRSAQFGTPDDWLSFTKADVILAFFGYNESFAGQAGLDRFKTNLDRFIKHTLSQRYSDKGPPRLVLLSPIAHEDLHDRNLPDGAANNRRLELYTAAMAEVAGANEITFVDLFQPSRALYARAPEPLTTNGIHLTEQGDQRLAQVIDRALFPTQPGPGRDPDRLEKLRQAVVRKNFYWFNRYRTVDGYSIYGGRADLKFVGGQTNREVMRREMEVLDVMTAHRDRRIWAVARGGDLEVDDGNTPPFIPVETNKPGPGPHGEHVFLDGEEAIAQMTVAPRMRVNLFASEKEFPELANPVQMSFDARGRLWVAVWPTYPQWRPKEEMNDKLLILEDTDGDGKADKVRVFADGLHCPTGFEFARGGVLIAQAPDLLFLRDADGDDRADVRERVLSGIDSADTHHTANSFQLDPGGALYFQEGTFHHTQVETPYGPPQRSANAAVFRYEPRTHKFEVYIPFAFANPHGHVFDRWGQDLVVDGTGAIPYHAALFSGHLDFPRKHDRPPQVYPQRTRPCPGIEFLSSRHFPAELQQNLLVANVIGFQGILQYRLEDDGASFSGTEVEPLLSSSDPNFRPTDIEIGPDGAIYFLDWQNPIIGHMQHNLRDPSRDRTHGRIYRVTYEGRPLLKPLPIAGEPIEKLLDLLKEPEDRVRYRARIELGTRETERVIAAVRRWSTGLDTSHPDIEHQMLEALWVHQNHNVVDAELLRRLLNSPDFHARAAATRVLCAWRDRVPDARELLKQRAADPHPRVRLEAVRAASFFTAAEAVEVPMISAEYPSDRFLEYTRGETMKALEPFWKRALAEGRCSIDFTSEAGARFLLRHLTTDELLNLKRGRAVDQELLVRGGVRDELRREALADLARLENESEVGVLIATLRSQDEPDGAQDQSVALDLGRLLTARSPAELAGVRGALETMAASGHRPIIRQMALIALIAADGRVDWAWEQSTRSVQALRDLLASLPFIRDESLRAELYPKVESLFFQGLPSSLARDSEPAEETTGRYVRVELPGRRTLTLAEVEVYSHGRNVARQGRAMQRNTSFGGDALRAIDGNTSGRYQDGGQTHTEVETHDPWWEVDLGYELPIESVVVFNRTEGDLGKRLDGFTLTILDGRRNIVFHQSRLPAPEVRAAYQVSGESPKSVIRRAAMNALTSVPGQETRTFRTLARFVRDGIDRHAAIEALRRIPSTYWPRDEVGPLLDCLVDFARTLPARERTSAEALDALQLGDDLATLLPEDHARRVRAELGALGVRVIRIGTVPEQMLFDPRRIVVAAGRPVQIMFENNDHMPHNLVLTRPGALEEVGLLAEARATQPRALEQQYVPSSSQILLASRLLQPRESQTLDFHVPERAAVYPYVCTYPGHWRRMYGAIFVVEDLEAYRADPDGYLTRHPPPIADEMLRSDRPRTQWTLEALASELDRLDRGRSFENGRRMFRVAQCVACHRLNGDGHEVGPDLSKLDPMRNPADILRDILEPSARIDPKYATSIFETESGKILTGLVLEETPEAVKVIENPMTQSPPVRLERTAIVERAPSPTSLMPRGLLDPLSREEVLDLLAYIASRGDQRSPLFQARSESGHGYEHGHEHGGGQ